MLWGKENEKTAILKFSEMYGLAVSDCGIFLSADGLLGASPDGILDEAAIIEVKCPYSWRNFTDFAGALDKAGCFLEKVNGEYRLKETHDYYHQVQGQMHLSKRSVCYFVVYIPRNASSSLCDVASNGRGHIYHHCLYLLKTYCCPIFSRNGTILLSCTNSFPINIFFS